MSILSRAALLILISAAPSLAAEKIDINTASLEELQEIIWVGPVMAQKIMDARPFYSLDDLTKVNGIGEKRLKDIKEEGLAWVAEREKPAIEINSSSANIVSSIAPQEEDDEEEKVESDSAAADRQAPEASAASLQLFLTALSMAIFSGTVIIFLKKKLT
jgi:competence ComEA-like helix-hairpin-helix protein